MTLRFLRLSQISIDIGRLWHRGVGLADDVTNHDEIGKDYLGKLAVGKIMLMKIHW